MTSQLTRGLRRRLLYGDLDGLDARIGWVRFSKTGRTVYYRGRSLCRAKGGGVRGNFFDAETGEAFWISGVKRRGSNAHWAEQTSIAVDEDAIDEYRRIRGA